MPHTNVPFWGEAWGDFFLYILRDYSQEKELVSPMKSISKITLRKRSQ